MYNNEGSSGSPIINLENNKVIGIHRGRYQKNYNFNIGTFLKIPINEYFWKIKKVLFWIIRVLPAQS